MSTRKQLLTYHDAEKVAKQHKKPCSDCPFARTAFPGWLAGMTPEEWLAMVHGETKIDCHTKIPAQCAGSAIYRGNMCKRPRDSSVLVLPANREIVFATPMEFQGHHDI